MREAAADDESELANADVVVAEDIYIPRIHVASMETCGCVAKWDPVEGHLTLYMTTQAPHAIRTVVALVTGHLGLMEHTIRVISPDIGGGFGGKVDAEEMAPGHPHGVDEVVPGHKAHQHR